MLELVDVVGSLTGAVESGAVVSLTTVISKFPIFVTSWYAHEGTAVSDGIPAGTLRQANG